MEDLNARLARRRAGHLYRHREVLQSPQGVEVRIEGNEFIAFCSNDYLGLANDPRVVAAFKAGADRYGAGAGASHLITGHSRAHHQLEQELAAFVGAPRAVLFSTGYMANLAVVATLLNRHGTVFEDKLNHASLIDAARLSQARVRRYRHGDTQRLAELAADAGGDGLIVTDGVFSMDGDMAPLPALFELARRFGARLLVDDAHGLGVLGANGRGMFEQTGVPLVPPAILMGTLGKAFGTFGAFVAASEDVIETLVQEARPYIYTTALPPAVAEATRESLRIVQQEPWRRRHLQQLVQRFREGAGELGLQLHDSATPIQPVILGSAEQALRASARLRQQRILVTAIRPPTVPENTARLRITFSAAHTEAQVDRLLDALAGLGTAA